MIETIIVGAGPGGLQLAYLMQRAGREYTVLDQADGAGRCAMRLIAAPVLDAGSHVVGLHGVKQMLPRGARPSRQLDPTIFVML